MFNLLQGISREDGQQSMSLSRMYTDDKPKPITMDYLESLAKQPAIIISEGAPLNGEEASFVRLSDFVIGAKEISFDIRCEPQSMSFPASLLETNKARHSLSDRWNWCHTCWQTGVGNIFETLYKAPTPLLLNKPKIFELNEPPEIDLNKVACMMPFHNSFDDVYTSIKGSCTDLSLDCERVDEIYNNKPIIADVVKLIDEAGLIVCDLTGKNPNVLYETGIAHALGAHSGVFYHPF